MFFYEIRKNKFIENIYNLLETDNSWQKSLKYISNHNLLFELNKNKHKKKHIPFILSQIE